MTTAKKARPSWFKDADDEEDDAAFSASKHVHPGSRGECDAADGKAG